jgi:hypothetical protein
MDIPDANYAEQQHDCSLGAQYDNHGKEVGSIHAEDVKQRRQKQ